MKRIHTFEEFLRESRVNEAKSIDLKLSTNEYPMGTVNRFRMESENINLRKVINLSKEPCCRDAKAFSDNEIGFSSARDRDEAMKVIQKSFDSGKNDVREFLNESLSMDAAQIHNITGSGQSAAQDFIDDNDIDSKKLVDYLIQYRNSAEKYDIRDLIKDPKSNKKLLQKFVNEIHKDI